MVFENHRSDLRDGPVEFDSRVLQLTEFGIDPPKSMLIEELLSAEELAGFSFKIKTQGR